MAITIKNQAEEPTVEEVQTATGIPYLSDELSAEVMALAPEIVAKFLEFEELTPEVIEAVAADIPEDLTEKLITELEVVLSNLTTTPPATPAPAPAPAPKPAASKPAAKVTPATPAPVTPAPVTPAATPPADDRADRRAALQAQIAQATGGTVKPPKAEQATPTAEVAQVQATVPANHADTIAVWDQIFPVGLSVNIVNRGNGRFELTLGSAKPATTSASGKSDKPAKPRAGDITWQLTSDEYFEWMQKMRDEYPTFEDKLKLAESLGLKRGEDWASHSKAGQPLTPSIENMYMQEPLRLAMGVHKYIEGARTDEERRAIVRGEKPMPAGAKLRRKGTGEVITAE